MFEDEDDVMHPCEMGGCTKVVPFDDEPYCYIHSSPKGSYMVGYSYTRLHRKRFTQKIMGETYIQHNLRTKSVECAVFTEDDQLLDVDYSFTIIDDNRVRVRPHINEPCMVVITA